MSWKPNSDQDINNEYEWEYKRHWHHTGLFPTKQHFTDSVKNAEIVEITPEIDQHIGNRSHTKSIDDLKDLVSGYNYPRDVDSIVDGLHSGSPLPHPIVIKHNGNMSILSGNTRMDQAFIHGINPQVALIDLDRPSDSLEKMSQPKIRFPNFPKVSTRPDQDVQVMTTPRQKKLFGRKVAQARNRDKVVPYTQMDQNLKVVSEGTKLMSQQATRDKEAKYLEGLFSRNTLGLNAQVQPQKRSYAAAVGGQLQSKFEAPDDEHKEKMDAHREKRNQVVEDYNKRYMDWRYKADELSRKITNPKDENDPGRKAYFEHMLQKPTKPKLPRQPSRKKVSTEDLSPAAQQIRGKQTDATVEHEALHNLMDQVEHHYGRQAARKIQGKLLEQFDMNALSKVGMFIADRMGYKPKSDHFNEEILAHARDILVNPRKREAFEKYAGQDARQHINSLKAGYKKALKWTKKVRPEDVGIQSEPVIEEPGKIAQSRLQSSELDKTRGRLTLPKFKRVTTRPDQDIQNVDSTRQAELFARKAGNQFPSQRSSVKSGVNKLYEYGSDPATAKYNAQYASARGHSLDPKDVSSFGAVVGSVTNKGVGFVSREGESPTSQRRQHESIHLLINDAADKYGHREHGRIYNHLNSFIHPDVQGVLADHLRAVGYDDQTHRGELLPHLYELLNDPHTRTLINATTGGKLTVDVHNKAKQSWSAILKEAKKLEPSK